MRLKPNEITNFVVYLYDRLENISIGEYEQRRNITMTDVTVLYVMSLSKC
jgi:hypothetical protein